MAHPPPELQSNIKSGETYTITNLLRVPGVPYEGGKIQLALSGDQQVLGRTSFSESAKWKMYLLGNGYWAIENHQYTGRYLQWGGDPNNPSGFDLVGSVPQLGDMNENCRWSIYPGRGDSTFQISVPEKDLGVAIQLFEARDEGPIRLSSAGADASLWQFFDT